jgi:hypothetical protein
MPTRARRRQEQRQQHRVTAEIDGVLKVHAWEAQALGGRKKERKGSRRREGRLSISMPTTVAAVDETNSNNLNASKSTRGQHHHAHRNEDAGDHHVDDEKREID